MRPSRHRFTKSVKRKILKRASYVCESALNMISADSQISSHCVGR